MSVYAAEATKFFNLGTQKANEGGSRSHALTLPKQYRVFFEAAYDKQSKIRQAEANARAKVQNAAERARVAEAQPLIDRLTHEGNHLEALNVLMNASIGI